MKRTLTQNEWFALAGAAIHSACCQCESETMSSGDQSTLLQMNALSVQLMKASGLNPTQIKDLGLSILQQVRTR